MRRPQVIRIPKGNEFALRQGQAGLTRRCRSLVGLIDIANIRPARLDNGGILGCPISNDDDLDGGICHLAA